MSNLTPFYQDDLTTIYHGDCEEIAPKLGRFDLLLTDPPYGLASKLKMKGGKNWANFHKNYNDKTWDEAPPPYLLYRESAHLLKTSDYLGRKLYSATACALLARLEQDASKHDHGRRGNRLDELRQTDPNHGSRSSRRQKKLPSYPETPRPYALVLKLRTRREDRFRSLYGLRHDSSCGEAKGHQVRRH